MITGSMKSQVDKVWDTFWSGGISNPITVIEQFTYLLFMKQLDERQASAERRAQIGLEPRAEELFYRPDQQHLRWRDLIHETSPEELHRRVSTEAFLFIKTIGGDGFSKHMQTATFVIDSPSTLKQTMELIDKLDLQDRDLTGDLYEYMLSKLTTAGTNGQFRTPSHIMRLMVALMDPRLEDRIIDPACGTAGFLVAASEWAKTVHEEDYLKTNKAEHFYGDMFHGYDFDSTMVRIAAMNMAMHGFSEPNIAYADSLLDLDPNDLEQYSLVLANPPFAGSVTDQIDETLKTHGTTKKTELLFLTRFLTLLRIGGRAAVIVPEGVLFGSTKVHKALRKTLINDHVLDAVIKLPAGTFKPYSGVSTAILCFTKTNVGGTKNVWFYDIRSDGYSLDDKRTPLLDANLLGPTPTAPNNVPDATPEKTLQPVTLTAEQLENNNLPDVLARWLERDGSETTRARTDYSFCVPVEEIRDAGYDLSMNRYKEIVLEQEETRDPREILAEIKELDASIAEGLIKLEQMLGKKQS